MLAADGFRYHTEIAAGNETARINGNRSAALLAQYQAHTLLKYQLDAAMTTTLMFVVNEFRGYATVRNQQPQVNHYLLNRTFRIPQLHSPH